MTEIWNIASPLTHLGPWKEIAFWELRRRSRETGGKQKVPPAYKELTHPQPFTALP